MTDHSDIAETILLRAGMSTPLFANVFSSHGTQWTGNPYPSRSAADTAAALTFDFAKARRIGVLRIWPRDGAKPYWIASA